MTTRASGSLLEIVALVGSKNSLLASSSWNLSVDEFSVIRKAALGARVDRYDVPDKVPRPCSLRSPTRRDEFTDGQFLVLEIVPRHDVRIAICLTCLLCL
jgi:hypothetical protein